MMDQGVIRRRDLVGAAGIILGMALPTRRILARRAPATVPNYVVPKLSEALRDSVKKGLTIWDPAQIDYVVEEYFMAGTAPVYTAMSMADVNVPQPKGVPSIADPRRPLSSWKMANQNSVPTKT